MITLPFRRLCCAAFLLAASTVWAANAVPGMEVVVMKGSSIAFRGFTDSKGGFQTGPLEPGIYAIEVRTVPNAPPSSARFFLSLGGAKPLGEATIRPGVALAMNATVRNPAGFRGQVTARGGIVYVRSNQANAAKVAPAGTALASASPSPVTKPATVPPSPPSAYPPRIVDGRRYFWVPVAPGSNLGRWLPENAAASVQPARSNRANAKASPTPSRTRPDSQKQTFDPAS